LSYTLLVQGDRPVGYWRLDYPERTNLFLNPNFANSASNWTLTAVSGSINTSQYLYGNSSFELITSSTIYAGFNTTTKSLGLGNGRTYNFSFYLKSFDTAFLDTQLYLSSIMKKTSTSDVAYQQNQNTWSQGYLGPLGSWNRYSLQATPDIDSSSVQWLAFNAPADANLQNKHFLVDGVILESGVMSDLYKIETAPYFDGYSENSYWTGAPDNSTSKTLVDYSGNGNIPTYFYRTNLLTNPSFETNTTGWGENSGQAAARVPVTASIIQFASIATSTPYTTASVTTPTSHGLSVGTPVVATASLAGNWGTTLVAGVIDSVPTATTFTFPSTASLTTSLNNGYIWSRYVHGLPVGIPTLVGGLGLNNWTASVTDSRGNNIYYISTPNMDITGLGKTFTFSTYVSGSISGSSAYARINFFDGTTFSTYLNTGGLNPAGTINGTAVPITASSYSRLTVTANAPYRATHMQVTVQAQMPNINSSSSLYLLLDNAILENHNVNYLPYFDGSTDGAEWTGTAHASTSTMKGAIVSRPALVAGDDYSINIISGAGIKIKNNYDIFYQNFERNNFDIEFWFSFNDSFDGSGYIKNSTASTVYFANNVLKFFKILNGTTEIGSINYDYDSNTFRFSIAGIGNADAYIPVRNMNTPFYIVASYSNKKLSIFVNGEQGVSGQVIDTLSFPTKSSNNGNFIIEGKEINYAQMPKGFLVSNLAFYDYNLSIDSKRKKVVWAYNNQKPTAQSRTLQLSSFDTTEKSYQVLHYDNITGNNFSEYVDIFNLNVDESLGLVPNKIPAVSLSQGTAPNATLSYTKDRGASLNDYGSFVINNLGDLVGINSPFTITSRILTNNASAGNGTYVFSFTDENTNNLIYGYLSTPGFSVYSYDFNTSTSNFYGSAAWTTSSAGGYAVGATFNNSNLNVYIAYDPILSPILPSQSASATYTINPIKLKKSSQLEFGNCLALNSSSQAAVIGSIGISNYINNLTGYDFTTNKKYIARMLSDFSVAQIGSWTKLIPLSSYDNKIVSSKVIWDGMDNCLVETSIDKGKNWSTVTKNSHIPGLTYGSINSDVLIRVTFPTEYTLEEINQSFNNLEIVLYENTSFLTENNKYELTPIVDSSGINPYNIQRFNQPITYMQNNFGIKFTNNQSYAKITPALTSASVYGIEFWLKFDNFTGKNILTTSDPNIGIYISNSSNPYYHIIPSASASLAQQQIIQYARNATLYVNGEKIPNNVTNNPSTLRYTLYSPVVGKYVHYMYDFGGPAYLTEINLSGSAAGNHVQGTFGSISLWSSSISSVDAKNRYLSYLEQNIVKIPIDAISTTNDANASTKWQPNWSNDAITTACAFKIG